MLSNLNKYEYNKHWLFKPAHTKIKQYVKKLSEKDVQEFLF